MLKYNYYVVLLHNKIRTNLYTYIIPNYSFKMLKSFFFQCLADV